MKIFFIKIVFRILLNQLLIACMLTMEEALSIIDSGHNFSATFCTADENRKTGGEIIHYDDIRCDGHHYPDPIRKFLLPNKRTITVHLFLIKDINSHRIL